VPRDLIAEAQAALSPLLWGKERVTGAALRGRLLRVYGLLDELRAEQVRRIQKEKAGEDDGATKARIPDS
jgi:hypothetical protein